MLHYSDTQAALRSACKPYYLHHELEFIFNLWGWVFFLLSLYIVSTPVFIYLSSSIYRSLYLFIYLLLRHSFGGWFQLVLGWMSFGRF